jgi:hypothetical protein
MLSRGSLYSVTRSYRVSELGVGLLRTALGAPNVIILHVFAWSPDVQNSTSAVPHFWTLKHDDT